MSAVRAALPGDRDAIVAVDTVAASEPGRVAQIEEWLDRGQLLVCCDSSGNVVLGYLALTQEFFRRPFVAMVMVAPHARRRGVAATLLRHAISMAGGELWTSTNVSNRPMQDLVLTLGFRPAGQVDGLDPGDPELFFHWSLQG